MLSVKVMRSKSERNSQSEMGYYEFVYMTACDNFDSIKVT